MYQDSPDTWTLKRLLQEIPAPKLWALVLASATIVVAAFGVGWSLGGFQKNVLEAKVQRLEADIRSRDEGQVDMREKLAFLELYAAYTSARDEILMQGYPPGGLEATFALLLRDKLMHYDSYSLARDLSEYVQRFDTSLAPFEVSRDALVNYVLEHWRMRQVSAGEMEGFIFKGAFPFESTIQFRDAEWLIPPEIKAIVLDIAARG